MTRLYPRAATARSQKGAARRPRFAAACLSALLLCIALLSLASCGEEENTDVPEGFALASDPAVNGFALYVPLGWTSYTDGDVCRAYVSPVDRTSVSATAVVSLLSPEAYFDASRADIEAAFGGFSMLEETVTERDGKAVFSVRFSGVLEGVSRTVCQSVFEMDGAHLAVLTCQASNEPVRGRDETRYQQHAEDLANVIAYFRVTGTPGRAAEPTFDVPAPDGMKCACDKRILGCVLFVPQSWRINYADGAVSAAAEDGTNVGLLRIVNRESESVLDYIRALKEEYRTIWDEENVTADMNDPAPETVGGITYYRFFLTVRKDGATYRIEQAVAVRTRGLNAAAYLITYTVKDENAAAHESEWQSILEAWEL